MYLQEQNYPKVYWNLFSDIIRYRTHLWWGRVFFWVKQPLFVFHATMLRLFLFESHRQQCSELLLHLYSEITVGGIWEPCRMPEIEPFWPCARQMANSIVLSCWPRCVHYYLKNQLHAFLVFNCCLTPKQKK